MPTAFNYRKYPKPVPSDMTKLVPDCFDNLLKQQEASTDRKWRIGRKLVVWTVTSVFAYFLVSQTWKFLNSIPGAIECLTK